MVLSFSMQPQEQMNWCWAACAASTASFFDPACSWTQCGVANGELRRSDCCDHPVPAACDVFGYLDRALDVVGHFGSMLTGAVSESSAYGEIVAERPLGIRVAWSGGGAHFVMCIGDDNAGLVTVADPFYGTSTIPYGTLQIGYQGAGTWTHSYFTKT